MAPADGHITRADIESKLREIREEVETTTTAAKPYALAAGVAVAVVVLGLTYLMGRRRGKKKTTLVEVRRV